MMKATRFLPLLPLLLLAFSPLAQSCGEATAAESIQAKPKKAKPDATFTGKIEQWAVVDNGSIYIEVTGKNMKGKEGSIWVKAMPAKTTTTGLAFKALQIILHYDGVITVEGKKRSNNTGSTAMKAMDLLKIGKFTPGEKN